MRNVRLVIEYDGTDFFGWQYQLDKRTVQGEIETSLYKIISENIRIIGAGRTDQGVHARGQVANFHTSSKLALHQIRNGINALTGDDIYIKDIDEVVQEFNSRYSARSKIYHYRIISEPSPLEIRYNWFVKYRLDVPQMKKVIPLITGEHDFSNFSAADESSSKVCKIDDMTLTADTSHIIIKIKGNRFLRTMIRGIVGFMYEVGRGRCFPKNTKDVFNGKIKDYYFAPPCGLTLEEVRY